MNCKVIPAQQVSFIKTCKEVLEGDAAMVVFAEGVREYDPLKMASDFETQQGLRPSKERACFYSIISFHPEEKPSDKTLLEIGQKYLETIGIVDTQYVLVKRLDTDGLTLHLIANMVNNEGKVIKDNYIWIRGEQAARKLTKHYFVVTQENTPVSLP